MKRIATVSSAIVILCLCMVMFSACNNKPAFKTPYQAVLLINGFAYFGAVEDINKDFLVLTDVFYIQTQTSPDGKPVANILVKRGKEWHGPDRMFINRTHILMVEPVSPDSKLAQLIKEEKGKLGETKK
jgi:hypothetical protein